jgi:hypothetical protein
LASREADRATSGPTAVGFREPSRSYRSEDLSPRAGNVFEVAPATVRTGRTDIASPAGDATGGERTWILRAFDLSETTAGADLPAGDGLRVPHAERTALDRLGRQLSRAVGDDAGSGFSERGASHAVLSSFVELRVAENPLLRSSRVRILVRTSDATADEEATPLRASEAVPAQAALAVEGPAVAPVGAAAVDRPVTRVADVAGSALAEQAAVSAALVPATDRRAAENLPAVTAVPGAAVNLVPGVYVHGGGDGTVAFRRPVYGAEPTPVSQVPTAGNARVAFPETKPGGGADPTPAPEAAGLLTNTLPFSLAALERAILALTEPEAEAPGSGPALWHWLGLSSWVLASAFAYEVARRRRATPGPADAAPFGEPGLLPEGLS